MKKIEFNGIFSKLFAIAIIVLLLLIGIFQIKQKMNDRQYTWRNAISTIESAAGGSVQINEIFIEVPYEKTIQKEVWDKDKKYEQTEVVHNSIRILSSELFADADVSTQYKNLGIYTSPVFSVKVKTVSKFDTKIKSTADTKYDLDNATIYMPVRTENLSSIPAIRINGTEYKSVFKEHILSIENFHIKNDEIVIETELDVHGANSFSIETSQGITKANIKCDWKSPNFTNYSFGPSEHRITDDGFTASWLVPFSEKSSKIGFTYADPVNLYSMLDRSINYGFMFIIIPFIVFFLFEIFAKVNFHPVHYLLSGAACAVFFLLLFSMSEHISFGTAYLISALAVALLVSFYIGSVSGKLKLGLLMVPAFAGLYGYLYISLHSEDYALMIGSVFIFLIIAAVMIFTRKVEWKEIGTRQKNISATKKNSSEEPELK